MARVKFDTREVDQNFQIENGIRKILRQSSRAVIPLGVIDDSYELEDEDCWPTDGTLADKCQTIADCVGARFRFRGEHVIFERPSES